MADPFAPLKAYLIDPTIAPQLRTVIDTCYRTTNETTVQFSRRNHHYWNRPDSPQATPIDNQPTRLLNLHIATNRIIATVESDPDTITITVYSVECKCHRGSRCHHTILYVFVATRMVYHQNTSHGVRDKSVIV
jgi:hypothetical protein